MNIVDFTNLMNKHGVDSKEVQDVLEEQKGDEDFIRRTTLVLKMKKAIIRHAFIPVQAVIDAQMGRRVLVVGQYLITFSGDIGEGALFVRSDREHGLKSVLVDTVYLLPGLPELAEQLAIARLSGQIDPRLIRL